MVLAFIAAGRRTASARNTRATGRGTAEFRIQARQGQHRSGGDNALVTTMVPLQASSRNRRWPCRVHRRAVDARDNAPAARRSRQGFAASAHPRVRRHTGGSAHSPNASWKLISSDPSVACIPVGQFGDDAPFASRVLQLHRKNGGQKYPTGCSILEQGLYCGFSQPYCRSNFSWRLNASSSV